MSAYPPPPPPPPQLPPRTTDIPTKILVIAAIGMGVGFGTCSLAAISAGGQNKIVQGFIGFGSVLFFASLAVLILTGFYMVVAAILRSFKR